MTSRTPRRRAARLAVLPASLSLLALSCSADDAPTAEPVVMFDADPMGALHGLSPAAAVIEGTVVEVAGPKVTLTEYGLVDWEGNPSTPPLAIVDDWRVVGDADADRPDWASGMERLYALEQAGESLQLGHTDGLYEVGRTYVFTIVPSVSGHSALFGYDVEAGRPAKGFDFDASREQLARAAAVGGLQDDPAKLLLAIARDLNRAERGEEYGSLAAEFGIERPTTATDPPGLVNEDDRYYPFDRSAFADQAKADQFVDVELLIFGDAADLAGSQLGLRGEKTLGWFAFDDEGGYAVVSGAVPRDELLTFAVRDDGETDLGRQLGGHSFRATPADEKTKQVYGIVDLTSESRVLGQPVMLLDRDSFIVEVSKRQALLDASVGGPEPTDPPGQP